VAGEPQFASNHAAPIGYSTTSTTTASSNVIWQVWNDVTVTSASTTLNVWPQWNQVLGATNATVTTTGTDIAWRQWIVNMGTGAAVQVNQTHARVTPRKKTEAEVREELRQQELWKKQELERQAKEALAKQNAERLLLAHLSEEQREQLKRERAFTLHLPSGRKYRIGRGTHGNVQLLDESGQPIRRYCAQPPGVPVDDAVLAQKLALETDEEGFLRVANMTPLR